MYRNSAKKRHFVFALTFQQFEALITQPCAYSPTGVTPDVAMGIDRKDSSAGYTPNNCVPCCPRHNEIKSNVFTYDQMREIVQNYNIVCGASRAGRKRKGLSSVTSK